MKGKGGIKVFPHARVGSRKRQKQVVASDGQRDIRYQTSSEAGRWEKERNPILVKRNDFCAAALVLHKDSAKNYSSLPHAC